MTYTGRLCRSIIDSGFGQALNLASMGEIKPILQSLSSVHPEFFLYKGCPRHGNVYSLVCICNQEILHIYCFASSRLCVDLSQFLASPWSVRTIPWPEAVQASPPRHQPQTASPQPVITSMLTDVKPHANLAAEAPSLAAIEPPAALSARRTAHTEASGPAEAPSLTTITPPAAVPAP